MSAFLDFLTSSINLAKTVAFSRVKAHPKMKNGQKNESCKSVVYLSDG